MTRKYIAYTHRGRKYRETGPHDTREAAAAELFAMINSNVYSVETALAVEIMPDTWKTYGQDIRPVRRDQV